MKAYTVLILGNLLALGLAVAYETYAFNVVFTGAYVLYIIHRILEKKGLL